MTLACSRYPHGVVKGLRFLLGLESLAVAALAVLLVILMIRQTPTNLPAALFEVIFAIVVAVTLWIASRGKLRSAAILLNIMALPISRTLLQGERTWIAIPVAIVALATLVALFLDRKSLA